MLAACVAHERALRPTHLHLRACVGVCVRVRDRQRRRRERVRPTCMWNASPASCRGCGARDRRERGAKMRRNAQPVGQGVDARGDGGVECVDDGGGGGGCDDDDKSSAVDQH